MRLAWDGLAGCADRLKAKAAWAMLVVAGLLTPLAPAFGQPAAPPVVRPPVPAATPPAIAPVVPPTGATSAGPPAAAAPAAGPAAASQPQTAQQAAEELAAHRAAQEEEATRQVESAWLVNMARGLAPAPARPNERPTSALWQLGRRIVLLEAALRIQERSEAAYLQLFQARGEAADAYRQYAQLAQEGSAKAAAGGRAEQSKSFAAAAAQAEGAADALRAGKMEALSRYVELQPLDVQAWRTLLEQKLSLKQSAPERIGLLKDELAALGYGAGAGSPSSAPEVKGDLPAEKVADTLVLLADYLVRQGTLAEAEKVLHDATTVMPLNRQAKAMRVGLLGERATAEDRLDLCVTDFRLSPANLAAVSNLAAALAQYGLFELPVQVDVGGKQEARDRGAVGLYEYGATVQMEVFKDKPLPVDFLFQQAQTLAAAGRGAQAATVLRQAINQGEPGPLMAGAKDPLAPLPPIYLAARILLVEALAPGDKAASAAEAKVITDYYEAHKDKPALRGNANLLASFSWFYLQAAPERAVELARQAAKIDPKDALVRRSLGAALAVSGKADAAQEAAAELAPLAKAGEPWAIYYLAIAKRSAGLADEAKGLLKALAGNWPGHPAGIKAREALGRADAPPPADLTRIRQTLSSLPQGLFEFYRTPGRYAGIDIQLYSGTQPFEPVVFLVRLANKSGLGHADASVAGRESFPITVGEGQMVQRDILVSAAIQLPGETTPRLFRDYVPIRIPAPQVLQPGQWVLTNESLDVGPADQLLRLTPQAEKTFAFQTLINGIWTANELMPGPGGYRIDGQFVRKAFIASSDGVSELTDSSRRGPVRAKLTANRMLGSLLAEQQLAAAGRLSYQVRTMPAYRFSAPLESAAEDPDPQVRAFLADAVYPAGLSGKLLEAMNKRLADNNWLVRLLAVRLLGDRIKQPVAKEITRLAAEDPDALVRRLAQSYVDQWAAEAGAK